MSGPALTALSYADVRDWLRPRITARKFVPEPVYLPLWTDNDLKQPGPFVILTVGGGAGLSRELLFDRPFITLRVISRSQDHDGGEALANAVDAELCSFDSTGPLGARNANYITRTGGRPQLLMRDNAERYHFSASYITEVESGF